MRRSKPLAAVATVAALFALAACGGGWDDEGDDGDSGSRPGVHRAPAPAPRTPTAAGPRARGRGRARRVAPSRCTCPATRVPTRWTRPRAGRDRQLDPAGADAPLADPVHRDEDGQADPGARPGHRPRHAQRGLHRVDVHDQDGVNVGDRRPGHRRGGRVRHHPLAGLRDVPGRPGHRVLRRTTSLGGDEYKGPYTDKGKAYDGSTFDEAASTVTIKMAKPFPDMPYWGSFPAMGPIPLGDGRPTRRSTARTRCPPAPTRSTRSARRKSWSWSATTSGTRPPTRPAPVRRRASSSSSTPTRSRSTRSC